MLPKLQSIIEFLSLNLSDLYDKISLCNISDSSVAENSIKRQIVLGKGKWICYIYATTHKQKCNHHGRTGIFLIFLQFLYETRAFKINHNNENWNVLPYSTTKMPVSILTEKKGIFSHAYCGSSRSLHGVTTHVKPPGFKQLNWRIRENLSQAINNGSWYKLSLLVSEDAMIGPATWTYSVWRFAQNSWDMSPWNKHHYFRFYKLGVGKVITRLNLSCTPFKNGFVQDCQVFCSNHETLFEEILGLSLKCFVINRKIGLEGVEKNEGWAQEIQKPQSPHRGALTLCANAPPQGQFQIEKA